MSICRFVILSGVIAGLLACSSRNSIIWYQDICEDRTENFSSLVRCTEREVIGVSGIGGKNADLINLYFSGGHLLAKKVSAGQIPETQARYEWALMYSKLKSRADGRSSTQGPAYLKGNLLIGIF